MTEALPKSQLHARLVQSLLEGEGAERFRDGKLLISGACGRLGRALVHALHDKLDLIGLDRRPFLDESVRLRHYAVDLRKSSVRDIFQRNRISAVIHLGLRHNLRESIDDHHTFNVAGTQRLFDYCQETNVAKFVLLSSANVYGARPENPQFLTEDAPLLAGAAFSEIRDLIEVDMLAQSFFWKAPTTETVILRPAHILGAVRNAPSNYLRRKSVPTLLGFDPMIQVVHQRDVVQALILSLKPGARGVFNIAGPPPVALSAAIRELGRTKVAVPHPVAGFLLRQLWQLKLASFPAPELDFIRYVCMVSDQRARLVLGYRPEYGMSETLRAVDELA